MTKTSGTSLPKPGTSVAKSHNSTILNRRPVIDLFGEPIDNDILLKKYEIANATTEEEKENLENQLDDLELEKMTKTMGRRMRIGGSKKRKTGTKKRAARKGKRKSNRNKK